MTPIGDWIDPSIDPRLTTSTIYIPHTTTFFDAIVLETAETAQTCRIRRAMEFMTSEQIADLNKAFATRQITAAAIARRLYKDFGAQLLEKYGIEDIKPKSAQRHRRGECCPKAL